jgi:hypothetical protein
MTPTEAFNAVTDMIIRSYTRRNPRLRQLWELTARDIRILHKFNPDDWS